MEYRNQLFYFLMASWLLLLFAYFHISNYRTVYFLLFCLTQLSMEKIDFHSVPVPPQTYLYIIHIDSRYDIRCTSCQSFSALCYKICILPFRREIIGKKEQKHIIECVCVYIVHIIYLLLCLLNLHVWSITCAYASNQCNHKHNQY